MKHFSAATLAAALMLLAGGAIADPHEDKLRSILPAIRSSIVQQDVIDALLAFNEHHAGLSQADIDRMDTTWHSELGSSNRPLISSVVDNPVAARMREIVEQAGAEDIVITGVTGLSLAQSTPEIAIWLGDEPAFVQTVRSGLDAVFIDEIRFNEPTQSYQCRVSFTVADPDTGRPIGVVTIGFNADAL